MMNLNQNEEDWDVPLGHKKEKPWGYERPLAVFQGIFLKELFFYKDHVSSLHYHDEKEELFYLVKGQLRVYLEEKEIQLEPGEILRIAPGKPHRIIPLKDSLILELGTRMFGDVIRVADDYERPTRE
jgi:mannose-6-phosphate isomerase-like protein (cupin superfamily)